jgi:hypothetical protein
MLYLFPKLIWCLLIHVANHTSRARFCYYLLQHLNSTLFLLRLSYFCYTGPLSLAAHWMDSPIYLSTILTFRSVQSSPQSLHILILRILDLVIQKNLTVKVQRELGPLLHQLPTYTRNLMRLRRTLEGNAMNFPPSLSL